MLAFELIGSETVFPIRDDDLVVDIGRSSTCTLFLYSPTVAKHHVLFANHGGRYLNCLRLNRGYRTRLNGRDAAMPFWVVPGDVIEVGEFALRLRATE